MEHTIATNKEVIVRYTSPTKYDKSPRGAICRVMKDNAKYVLFIQIAPYDAEHSEWMTMGDFLEGVFENYLENRSFVHSCLNLLEDKNTKDEKDLVYGVAVALERIVGK